jgi:hypothetical protein
MLEFVGEAIGFEVIEQAVVVEVEDEPQKPVDSVVANCCCCVSLPSNYETTRLQS